MSRELQVVLKQNKTQTRCSQTGENERYGENLEGSQKKFEICIPGKYNTEIKPVYQY